MKATLAKANSQHSQLQTMFTDYSYMHSAFMLMDYYLQEKHNRD